MASLLFFKFASCDHITKIPYLSHFHLRFAQSYAALVKSYADLVKSYADFAKSHAALAQFYVDFVEF